MSKAQEEQQMTNIKNTVQFQLDIPRTSGKPIDIALFAGSILFCLGANGSGKTSLIQRFREGHQDTAVNIAAHRQTSLETSAVTLTAEQRRQQEDNQRSWWTNDAARWSGGGYSSQRPAMAIFDLIDGVNTRAREIADQVDSDETHQATLIAQSRPSPVSQINALLDAAGLAVKVEIRQGDKLEAHRKDGLMYSMAEMSDGERNAVLISAEVLTAQPGSLFLIDEPERHLHRSIIVPLLSALLQSRDDCAFVVATHEVGLPIDFPDARALVLRSAQFSGSQPVRWEAQLLNPRQCPDDSTKRAILGGRRTIIFVEGEDGRSLDRPLYQTLFPDATIVSKGSKHQVIDAVKGLRGVKDLAWVSAYGIVDRDFDDESKTSQLERDGIFPIPWNTVESIYYHPMVQREASKRLTEVDAGSADDRIQQAEDACLGRIRQQLCRLAELRVKAWAHRRMQAQIPADIDTSEPLKFDLIDVPEQRGLFRSQLEQLIEGRDVAAIVEQFPIHKSGAPDAIAKALGFQGRDQYESAVRKLLTDDDGLLEWVRGEFRQLVDAIAEDSQ